ncbi:MAG: hypothetical protein PVF56_01450 [Desulfobacterales bacterium]
MDHEFIVEFECPQCGAPASLEETSRLFACKFCGVKSYLVPREVFHYVLPSRAPEGMEIIYFPYWRLKGVLFICALDCCVYSEPIDLLYQAAPSDLFPPTPGFKAHIMKMRFAGQDVKGRIFEPTIASEDIIEQLIEEYAAGFQEEFQTDGVFYHETFVGLLEIIYAPFYIHDDTLYDGVSNEPVTVYRYDPMLIDEELVVTLPAEKCFNQEIKFIPTLCPYCGWDMDGARDSHLLACKNCNSFYKPRLADIIKLGVGFMPADANTALYLPFWRLRADISGIQLATFGDLIKMANLIKVVTENEGQRKFYFWIPAFKIASKLFLQIATHVTLCQPHMNVKRSIPDVPVYPVTLPISEALKCPKTVIANFIAFKEIHFPKLDWIEIAPKGLALIYLPFQALGSEFVHPDYKVRVTNKTLEHHRL